MTERYARILWIALVVWLANASAPAASQYARTASICEVAAARAAKATGVPLKVLRAISLTETGRKRDGAFAPWPWTVNMEGTGRWFDDPLSALAYVEKNMKRGAVSFDVGCFQINYRWHGNAFSSVEDMFDPTKNATYAARFLADLYREFGDWSKAAGAYHSRTPKYAAKYRVRFSRFLERIGADPEKVPVEVVEAKPNRVAAENLFPLLKASNDRPVSASLVPLGAAPRRRLIDIAGQ